MDGASLQVPVWRSRLLTDARRVVPVTRSRTKTSAARLVSPGTRFAAALTNATYRPVDDITGCSLSLRAWDSWLLTETRSVVPETRSRTNTSCARLVSPGTSRPRDVNVT